MRIVRNRISGSERRLLILEAARRVFSRSGFAAAKTQEIAREAKVSEALLYRHYPSKLALYRSVLRQIIREQDENYAILNLTELNAGGLVRTLNAYFRLAIAGENNRMQQGFRMLLASLSGDGNYANLIYRRAQRMMGKTIEQALHNAREAGDLRGEPLSPANVSMFIEHVGTMTSAIVGLGLPHTPYVSDKRELIRQAVWFCCRGIGFTEEAIARHIDE